MLLDEYQAETRRTASARYGAVGYTLGLVDECIEFHFSQVGGPWIDEAGDVLWYMARLADVYGINLSAIDSKKIVSADILECAKNVGEYVKKCVFHGHELEVAELARRLEILMEALAFVAFIFGSSLSDIMEHNVAKLRKRYPAGFETERSVNRA